MHTRMLETYGPGAAEERRQQGRPDEETGSRTYLHHSSTYQAIQGTGMHRRGLTAEGGGQRRQPWALAFNYLSPGTWVKCNVKVGEGGYNF